MKTGMVKIAGLFIASWVVMTTMHEFGHLIGGRLCGATLVKHDLAPWRLPYSIHSPDPHPLVTLWMGPMFGAVAPLLIALVLRRRWAWFVADFCLLANGTYLAVAWWSGDPLLDTQRLLAADAHPATILVYCAVTIGLGYVWFREDCRRYIVATRSEPEFHC